MNQHLKQTLIEAGRVLVAEGQGDYVAGHVSVRLPGDPNLFLMKPAGIGLDEMTPDNIILVDIEGRKVEGSSPRHNEVFIHSEVMRARADVQAVVHTRALHATVFSSLGRPLLGVNNDGVDFAEGLPVFSETTDLIIDSARGAAVARCLGPRDAVLLRNHGIVTAARSVEEAVWIALKLERACRAQLLAEAGGGPMLVADPADARAKNKRANRPDLHSGAFNYSARRAAKQA